MEKVIYYTYQRNRGAKWAHLVTYAVIKGRLTYTGSGKYQPGATAGIPYEVRRIAAIGSTLPGGTVEGWNVEEIRPGMS